MLSAAFALAIAAASLAQPQGGAISTRELAPPPGMTAAPTAPAAAPPEAPKPGTLREIGKPDPSVVVEEAAPAPEKKAAPEKPAAEKPKTDTVEKPADSPPAAKAAAKEKAPSPAAPRSAGGRVAAFWVILPPR